MAEKEENIMIAKVAKVVDNYRLVINKGAVDHVDVGDVFLIYEQGENITDPENDEDLGAVEIMKGRGKVTHVQERMALLESFLRETPVVRRRKQRGMLGFALGDEEEERPGYLKPFKDPKRGDCAKQEESSVFFTF